MTTPERNNTADSAPESLTKGPARSEPTKPDPITSGPATSGPAKSGPAKPRRDKTGRTRPVKPDPSCVGAVDQAREAARQTAGLMGVGEYLGHVVEADREVTHWFSCPHPGYPGWRWSVTVVRAAWAKVPTVNEVVLLPGEEALLAADWLPWADRIQGGDVAPGMLMPTPDNDPRLMPGYTGGELAADPDPAEMSQLRVVVAELGLGRERVLSPEGRDQAAARWLHGDGGPDNQMTRQAPAHCASCGYFLRLQGSLGSVFGACANQYSPSDGLVVSFDHGCGGHSDVIADEHTAELPSPVWDTITWDESGTLFD